MNEIYVIPCKDSEVKTVHLQKDSLCDWPVVWVDLQRLIQIWEASPRALLLPVASEWSRAKFAAYLDGIRNTVIPYTVLNVQLHGIDIGRLTVPRVSYGWDKLDQRTTVGFVNGRL